MLAVNERYGDFATDDTPIRQKVCRLATCAHVGRIENRWRVNFNKGSSKISTKDQQQLKTLAQTATSLTGYIVEVTGYADSTGSAAINMQLSENRAKAVIAFLMQQGGVPIRHIIAPGAMGEYAPAATNETKAGRAENRRVEVKVLVNKGIAGS
jgi:OmpA-OmpF porin, OOP family